MQLYSDVLADRDEQIHEKEMIRGWDRSREEMFTTQMAEQMSLAEVREQKESEARLSKAKEIATVQKWALIYLGLSSFLFVLVWIIGGFRHR